MKGPKINNTKRNFSGINSLGIQTPYDQMRRDLLPVLTLETTRAFYWALISWCYYDFNNVYPEEVKSTKKVFDYVKKHNYFFALSNMLNGNYDTDTFKGTRNIGYKINKDDSKFSYDESYISKYGSIDSYYTSTLSLDLWLDEKSQLYEDRINFANSFANKIRHTDYYKNREKEEFSKEALIELGKIVNIRLDGFDETKSFLRRYLFENEKYINLGCSKKLIEHIREDNPEINLNGREARRIFYDIYPKEKELAEDLLDIAFGWEILTGRLYFQGALELIWKTMLLNLNKMKTKREWIEEVLNKSKFSWDINQSIESIINKYNLTSEEIERSIYKKEVEAEESLEIALGILFSVYNKFLGKNNRNVSNKEEYFKYGGINYSITLNQFFRKVNDYKEKKVLDLLSYIMDDYLIQQHLITAENKLYSNNIDGYYIENIDGKFIKKRDFDLYPKSTRLKGLYGIMKDLK